MRMVFDHQGEHGSQWLAMQSIAAKIGGSGEALRNWAEGLNRTKILLRLQFCDSRPRLSAWRR
ncbi:hypothetical protein MBTS_03070 [Methylobacterium bullatum]|nr:hypothetical protein [Methylobacterium bullatum]